jgi:hypothetical protein
LVGVAVDVLVDVAVGVLVGVLVGVAVGVLVGVGVGAGGKDVREVNSQVSLQVLLGPKHTPPCCPPNKTTRFRTLS